MTRVRLSIEAWFNSTMDRVSGWYKRRTQIILFAVGLAMAATLNIDTVDICNHLVSDPSLRSSLVATAQEYAKNETLNGQRAAWQRRRGPMTREMAARTVWNKTFRDYMP